MPIRNVATKYNELFNRAKQSQMNLYTIKQFADICGVTYEAIRQRIESGTIKPIATNRTVINGDDYKDLINYLKLKSKT